MLNSKSTIKEWVETYPFLRIKDNSVYPWLPVDEDEVTECWMIGDLPEGWIDAFGDQICNELTGALGDYVDRWITVQVKEKFGSIRWYYHFDVKDLSDEEVAKVNEVEKVVSSIIDKYDEVSYKTCAWCGAPATHITTGYILPLCDKCFNENMEDKRCQ